MRIIAIILPAIPLLPQESPPILAGNEQEEYAHSMRNLLLEPIPYKVEETSLGVWRRFASEHGGFFEEFVSHRRLLGLPLFHYTRGICPETGRRRWAKGIVAIGVAFGIGQLATGFIAVGQGAAGFYVLAQKGIGRYVWDMLGCSPVARQFFEPMIP